MRDNRILQPGENDQEMDNYDIWNSASWSLFVVNIQKYGIIVKYFLRKCSIILKEKHSHPIGKEKVER